MGDRIVVKSARNDFNLIMENWNRFLRENEEAESMIDNSILIIENKEVVGKKDFDILFEELSTGTITEEKFASLLVESAEHEWGLVEEAFGDAAKELGQKFKKGATAMGQEAKLRWAKLKSTAILKGVKFAISKLNQVIKLIANFFGDFGMKLYIGAMNLLGLIGKGAAKVIPYVGPALMLLSIVLVGMAAYFGLSEVAEMAMSAIADAAAGLADMPADTNPAELPVDALTQAATNLCAGLVAPVGKRRKLLLEFKCGDLEISKRILSIASEVLMRDLETMAQAQQTAVDKIINTDFSVHYYEMLEIDGTLVKTVDYDLFDVNMEAANLKARAIKEMTADLHDIWSQQHEGGDVVKLHTELKHMRPEIAQVVEEAIQTAMKIDSGDPQVADAMAESGDDIRSLWSGHVKSESTDYSRMVTRMQGDESTFTGKQHVTQHSTLRGKNVPHRFAPEKTPSRMGRFNK